MSDEDPLVDVEFVVSTDDLPPVVCSSAHRNAKSPNFRNSLTTNFTSAAGRAASRMAARSGSERGRSAATALACPMKPIQIAAAILAYLFIANRQ